MTYIKRAGGETKKMFVKMNEQGRIVIPVNLREALKLEGGELLHMEKEDGSLKLQKASKFYNEKKQKEKN